MQRIFIGLIAGIVTYNSRAAEAAVPVSVVELISHPQKYASKRVRVTGVWLIDFEFSAFVPVEGDETKYSRSIWVEPWFDEKSDQKLSDEIERIRRKQGPSMSMVHVICEFEGVFTHNGHPQGHMGSYDSALVADRIYDFKEPNQSTDPTPASVTPVAGQPARQP